MRTNIDIDDELMARAMRVTGLKTKKAVVEEGLRRLAQLDRQVDALAALKGIGWNADTEELPFLREFAEDGTPLDERE